MRAHTILGGLSGLLFLLGAFGLVLGAESGFNASGNFVLAIIVAVPAGILALLNAGKTRCRHCRSRVRNDAAVCPHCRREGPVVRSGT